MTTIKEIYQWIINRPFPPKDLTSIQIEEWKKTNSLYLGKSYVGNTIVFPARVVDIKQNKVEAVARYESLARFSERNEKPYHNYLGVSYEIKYDNSVGSEKINSIFKNDFVEVEGRINSLSWMPGPQGDSWSYSPDYLIEIKLTLTKIIKIEKQTLHEDLLGLVIAAPRLKRQSIWPSLIVVGIIGAVILGGLTGSMLAAIVGFMIGGWIGKTISNAS